MKLRFPMLAALALVAACAPRQTLIPAPPVRDVAEVEAPVVEVAGIDDVAIIHFEPAPFEDVDPGPLKGDGPLPGGIDLSGYDMSMELNDQVQTWIDLFTGRERERFGRYLERQGLFEEMINSRLTARGLPSELLYLALIESGFSVVARSSANAIGLWQFIAGTARIEKLTISEFIDERRDPVLATEAALNHLEGLYRRFGSWYLAAAAYNSGAGRVERALSRQVGGARGHDSLFWSIHSILPAETRNYVPKLIAATVIARNRTLFQFDHIVPLEPLAVDTVEVPDATDLEVIAEAAGVELAQVAALNAKYYRGMTPPRQTAKVVLPGGRAETFALAYAEIPPDKRVLQRDHIVKRGETLSGIAGLYGVSVATLQEANGITRPSRIQIGQRIRIPAQNRRVSASSSSSARAVTNVASSTPRVTHYSVRPGDSIWSIARRQGVAPRDLLEWNSLTVNSVIKPGDRLIIRHRD